MYAMSSLSPSERFVTRSLLTLAALLGIVWLLSVIPFTYLMAKVSTFWFFASGSVPHSLAGGVLASFLDLVARHYTLFAFAIGLLWMMNILVRHRRAVGLRFDRWTDSAGIALTAGMGLVYSTQGQAVFTSVRALPDFLSLLAATVVLLVPSAIWYSRVFEETENPFRSSALNVALLFVGALLLFHFPTASFSGYAAAHPDLPFAIFAMFGNLGASLLAFGIGATYRKLRHAEQVPTRTLYADN